MDDIDLDALDAKVEAEHVRLVTALRHLADRLEALPLCTRRASRRRSPT